MEKSEPSLLDAPDGEEIEELLPRDRRLWDAIRNEGLLVFTFDGLRRLLGIHQETLSRTLGRLEEQGLVEKVADGYRVAEGHRDYQTALTLSSPTRPLVQTMLPPDTDVNEMVSALKGRWFGNLRWVGYSQTEEGAVLKWITDEEGTQLDVRFSGGLLTIEARIEDGNESSDAINASYQLLSHISKLYGKPNATRSSRTIAKVSYQPGLDFA